MSRGQQSYQANGRKNPMSSGQGEVLEFQQDAGRISPYAHLYRYGDTQAPGPLILYVGGSIAAAEYERRRSTAPTAILEQFDAAHRRAALPRVDLIICPCPVDTDGDGLDWMADHLDLELTPSLGSPPTALGCMGNSAGGAYAAHVAAIAEARALAVFGGAGILRTMRENRAVLDGRGREGLDPLAMILCRNADDPVQSQDEMQQVGREFGARVMAPLPGTHPFRDYAANGTVQRCFAFLLQQLARATP